MRPPSLGTGDERHWTRYVPGVRAVRGYRSDWVRYDVLAGLVLTALLVPQGLAYAELAGLPPVTGLYTTALALLAYAVFGPSRILVLGPDSSLGPMIAAAILPLVAIGADPGRSVALAGMLALLIGALCIGAGLARLGAVSELLSRPVRIGFLNGVALVVLVGQLPTLFGFRISSGSLLEEGRDFARGVADGDTLPAALVVGLAAMVVILVLARWAPKVPGILVAVVGASIAVGVFDLTAHGVPVVGAIASGFPSPTFPDVGLHDVGTLLAAAIGISFVVLADTTALSRTLAAVHGEHVDTNQEIVALGVANVATGLFQGFPVSASVSRSAVASSAGSRSQLTGVIGAVAVVAVLLFANGLGTHLPKSALAAIIITAALRLFDLRTMRWLWDARRSELWLCVAALAGVAVLGVLPGIVAAIALSIAVFVRRQWRPYDAVLGRMPGRKGYHDLTRHPEAEQIPGLLLYRFDAPLFFANADLFAMRLLRTLDGRAEPTRWVIVAAEPITDIDTTAAEVLAELLLELRRRGITLAFAELKGPVKDRLRQYGLYDDVGDEHIFPTLGTAIDAYLGATNTPWVDWSERTELSGEGDVPDDNSGDETPTQ